MDFGGHLDSLGLDFEPFLDAFLDSNFGGNCPFHFRFAFHFVVLQML